MTDNLTSTQPLAPSPLKPFPEPEKPLSGSVLATLILSATGVIILFHFYCLVALLGVGVLLMAELTVMIGLARFGAGYLMREPIEGLFARLGLVLRS